MANILTCRMGPDLKGCSALPTPLHCHTHAKGSRHIHYPLFVVTVDNINATCMPEGGTALDDREEELVQSPHDSAVLCKQVYFGQTASGVPPAKRDHIRVSTPSQEIRHPGDHTCQRADTRTEPRKALTPSDGIRASRNGLIESRDTLFSPINTPYAPKVFDENGLRDHRSSKHTSRWNASCRSFARERRVIERKAFLQITRAIIFGLSNSLTKPLTNHSRRHGQRRRFNS